MAIRHTAIILLFCKAVLIRVLCHKPQVYAFVFFQVIFFSCCGDIIRRKLVWPLLQSTLLHFLSLKIKMICCWENNKHRTKSKYTCHRVSWWLHFKLVTCNHPLLWLMILKTGCYKKVKYSEGSATTQCLQNYATYWISFLLSLGT